MWLHINEAVQCIGTNFLLYNLSQIRGTEALLCRIPDNLGGVYAWYRCFELNPAARHDPEIFVSAVLHELYKPHSVTRETRVPPSTKLTVQAETVFHKRQALQQFAQDSHFRELICQLLENSLIFQQPLYIGKATNFKQRIKNHLSQGSILRERLELSSHNINHCRLLIIGTSMSTADIELDKNIEEESDIEGDEFSSLDPERLIEDILSRLFLPTFSIQYG